MQPQQEQAKLRPVGRVFNQFPLRLSCCSYNVDSTWAKELLASSNLFTPTAAAVTQTYHKVQHSEAIGIFKSFSWLPTNPAVQAGWSSQLDMHRRAHIPLVPNRSWGHVQAPAGLTEIPSGSPQAQTLPKCQARPRSQPHKWTGRSKIPPSTTAEGSSPAMLGRGKLVLNMCILSHTTSAEKALNVLPKQNIQNRVVYLKNYCSTST